MSERVHVHGTRMVEWLSFSLYAMGAVAILATVLPLWRTTRGWVRIWDFPRFQVSIVALVVLLTLPLLRRPAGLDWTFLAALGIALGWQAGWIWRYLPGAPRELVRADAQPGAPDTITLVTTNVLQTNRRADRLLPIILDADPDVVLACETDEWWCLRLGEALRSRFAHAVTYPLSNGYGLALFSRFELIEPTVRFLLDDAIPSIRTGVRLRNGAVVDLHCEHPRPPAPRQDSTERDLEVVLAAREIKQRGRPAILLGDLNDVAWSPSTTQFSRVGGLLDPRRGRGFFNTYPARLPGLRYPLDHVFTTPHFALMQLRVLPGFGSDHLPLVAGFQLKGDPA